MPEKKPTVDYAAESEGPPDAEQAAREAKSNRIKEQLLETCDEAISKWRLIRQAIAKNNPSLASSFLMEFRTSSLMPFMDDRLSAAAIAFRAAEMGKFTERHAPSLAQRAKQALLGKGEEPE